MNGRDEPGRYYPSGTRNYFRLSAADDLSGAADAVLARQLRLRRVYALSDGSNYARATIARFTATAGKLHLTVVGSAAWNPSSRNDARVAATVAGTDPDGIFLAGFPLESGALIRALRARLGKRPALIGANGYLPISDLLGSAGKAALGMYVSDSISLSGAPDPAAERVLRALKNDEPTQALAGAYLPEAAQLTALILDAVAKSNGTRKSILDALARGHVSNGILGSFRFDANGDKTPATFTILRVTGRRAPGLITDFQGATVDRTVLLQPNLTGP